jgi:hypothetical protein
MTIQQTGCICDGGLYRPEQVHPFLVHPSCPVHGDGAQS